MARKPAEETAPEETTEETAPEREYTQVELMAALKGEAE